MPPVTRIVLSIAAMLALLPAPAGAGEVGDQIAAAALERTRYHVIYDPAYRRIPYPLGDVATGRGVCSDVVVRTLRALDVDLQRLMHEDMRAAFTAYPALWGLSGPDSNIDHRRVPNIETYFTRRHARLPASDNPADFEPGDIVAWNLKGGSGGTLAHIGVVTGEIGPSGAPMVVHNIGAGPTLEDVLFEWPMTGRFRLPDEFFSASRSCRSPRDVSCVYNDAPAPDARRQQ